MTALSDYNKKLQEKREEELRRKEAIEKQQRTRNIENIGKLFASSGNIYSKIQESKLKQADIFNKKMYYKLPGTSGEIAEIPVFERNPVAGGKGFIRDGINTAYAPADMRFRVNHELLDKIDKNLIVDKSGNPIDFHNITAENFGDTGYEEILNTIENFSGEGSTQGTDVLEVLKQDSNKPYIGEGPGNLLKKAKALYTMIQKLIILLIQKM